ncbi:MAG TPA: sensor domain-containing protein [Actinophytocola sp.]|uniref:sensor domain-containing protein n=1 Tax=Actinophytocola sp. TaxID=1872138 RepID=UPI002DDD27D5|nr:sensor domain-containing protein [Actinophytocola sp.]HEV2784548.1 sensor domain-containing protein [Actinophytocola sp.]
MAPANVTESDGTRPNPPVLGALVYLLLNLPAGIAGFVLVVTLLSVGLSTAIIWVGVPVLAVALLLWRGGARLERRRVHALLGTFVATPYRPLPEGMSAQWKTRVKDAATWKDMLYLVLLLPIGIAEFTLMVSFWSVSLWLLLMPLYFGFLPDDWYPVAWGHPFIRVDSAFEALPWAALGALLLAVTVALTKGLGSLHARYARAMLGPSGRKLDAMAGAPATPSVNWDFRTHVYPGV